MKFCSLPAGHLTNEQLCQDFSSQTLFCSVGENRPMKCNQNMVTEIGQCGT